MAYLEAVWKKDRELKVSGFDFPDSAIMRAIEASKAQIDRSSTVSILLNNEAQLTKILYKFAATQIVSILLREIEIQPTKPTDF